MRPVELLSDIDYRDLSARAITEETCRKFGYGISSMRHPDTGSVQKVQVARYYDDLGNEVAQKIRWADKTMRFLGGSKTGPLFGQHLWRKGGKRIIITEGEIDALSVSQVQGNKWPVVSIPNGAKAAAASLAAHIEYLEAFDEVVLCFDMDEPGRAAAAECAALFTPGKAKIANLPMKDANELLVAGRGKDLHSALWESKEFRPDGVLRVADLLSKALDPVAWGDPWPWAWLTKQTYGRRLGEVYALGAGTGVGKTDVFTQIIAYIVSELHKPCGLFFLEQSPVETLKRIAGKIAARRFHIPDGAWKESELVETLETLQKSDLLHLYDNFGATDWKVIKTTIKHLAVSNGVQDFFLDHLTALAAAESDERVALEGIMSEIAMLAKELNVRIHFISHLATPEGKPHEEGGRVMIRHFKGSRSIGFWSHFMFGLEREQQAEDEEDRRTTRLRILKDRYTGQSTGLTMNLLYDQTTGVLNHVEREAVEDFAVETPTTTTGKSEDF